MSYQIGDWIPLVEAARLPRGLGVYVIRNTISGKTYVGKSVSVRRRVQGHVTKHARLPQVIYRALRKHGIHAFEVCCQHVAASDKELLELEIALIKQHNSMVPFGYNMTEGGEGTAGTVQSPATIAKRKEAAAKLPSNTRAFLSYVTGPRSKEHAMSISEALKGKAKKVVKIGSEAPNTKPVIVFAENSFAGRYYDTQLDMALDYKVNKSSVGNWVRRGKCSKGGALTLA